MRWLQGQDSKFQVQPPNFLASPGPCNGRLAASSHAAMNVALADGSVRSVSPTISAATWAATLTPDGGEVIPDDLQ